MANILKPKLEGAGGITDLIAIGIAKQITERVATPYVGNGTVMSAMAKGVVGSLIHGKGGKIGKYASSGMIIDAAEDAALVIVDKFMGGTGSTAGGSWWN